MYLTIIRYSTTDESTLGVLLINGHFACYTLEDPYQPEKVANCTRIPGGIYNIGLYHAGRLNSEYSTAYPGIHKGMLNVRSVPNFEGVMFHIGNYALNTAGCILLGDKANNNMTGTGKIEDSAKAYIRVYPQIANPLDRGEEVTLLIGEPTELIKFEQFNTKGALHG